MSLQLILIQNSTPVCVCIYVYICIHIYFCVYTYKTLPFKMLCILNCLITSSWCHLPPFSMPCFSPILEIRAKISDSSSAFWQEYIPCDPEHFIKHLIRGHMMSGHPILGIDHLVRWQPPLSIADMFSFCSQHTILWVMLWYQVKLVVQQEISWNHLGIH